jgi:FkbM family methyltransferase
MESAVNIAGMVCTDSATRVAANSSSVMPGSPLQGGNSVSTTGVVQRLLLAMYKGVCRTGLMSTRLGRGVFLAAYERYKGIWDADHLEALGKSVHRGTTVIDVGANVGFYTRRFAEWVRPGGEVIAIEPEEVNFSTLKRVIARRGLVNVLAVQAVASERAGSLYLQRNPFHPADHRIAEGTGVVANEDSDGSEPGSSASCQASRVRVRSVTIDDVLRERGQPKVSLMKIDVQGAEERVLRGAMRTLRELRPPVFMEVDEAALRAMGSSAESVLELMISCRYEPHRIVKGGPVRVSRTEAVRLCSDGTYVDFLFLPAQ